MNRKVLGMLAAAGVILFGSAGAAAAAEVDALATPTASADTPADAGTAFVPRPQSQELYAVDAPPSLGVTGPGLDPRNQIYYVPASDNERIYTETYLPARKPGGVSVPPRYPTILISTPYETVSDFAVGATLAGGQYFSREHHEKMARHFAARGYAVTVAHTRGTGMSDGCNDYHGPLERDDVARVVEYLAVGAPWASGRVGMIGLSYGGGAPVAAATLGAREHPDRMQYLKAIVPMAAPTSAYAFGGADGVPFAWAGYPAATAAMMLFATPDAGRPTDRAGCQATEHAARMGLSPVSGDFTAWAGDREQRRAAGEMRVPMLMASNLFDTAVAPSHVVGFFNRIPSETPHKLILTAAGHGPPEIALNRPAGWQRYETDWYATVTAWYDRWLKGLDTGVEDWPAVQVQEATTGQWRSEDSWPPSKAPEGRLALSAAPAADHAEGFALGETRPFGSTTYSENSTHPAPDDPADRGQGAAIWWSQKLDEPLHLTGEPRLDLWVELDQPDAHLVANLQAFDAGGRPLLRPGGADSAVTVLVADGRRSVAHLDPLVDERFEQSGGRPLEHPEQPRLIPIRFWPVDVLVPAGGRLRLSLAGVSRAEGYPSLPSEASANVEVLHDCAHTSVLRFNTPSSRSRFLNVKEPDEQLLDPLPSNPPSSTPANDGGGIGKRRICG